MEGPHVERAVLRHVTKSAQLGTQQVQNMKSNILGDKLRPPLILEPPNPACTGLSHRWASLTSLLGSSILSSDINVLDGEVLPRSCRDHVWHVHHVTFLIWNIPGQGPGWRWEPRPAVTLCPNNEEEAELGHAGREREGND